MKTKICSKCKTERDASFFSPDKKAKSGLKSQCRICVREYAYKRYWENPDFHRERTKTNISKKRDFYNENRRKSRLKTHITESARKYGVSKEDIIKLLEIKNCQICNTELSMDAENYHHKPNIDHCHSTGKIRGVLCGYCNNLIGRAKDSVEILMLAIKYLQREEGDV